MRQCQEAKTAERRRLEGGGGKVISEDLERTLIQWVFTMKRQGLRVSRKMIMRKAEEVFREVEDASKVTFKVSRGWLDRFMSRSGLRMRRRTTAAQKTPQEMTDKMVSFIRYIWNASGQRLMLNLMTYMPRSVTFLSFYLFI